ncbi:MAG: hypothetical protein MHMPM18_004921 [Marteilia pararefringens]
MSEFSSDYQRDLILKSDLIVELITIDRQCKMSVRERNEKIVAQEKNKQKERALENELQNLEVEKNSAENFIKTIYDFTANKMKIDTRNEELQNEKAISKFFDLKQKIFHTVNELYFGIPFEESILEKFKNQSKMTDIEFSLMLTHMAQCTHILGKILNIKTMNPVMFKLEYSVIGERKKSNTDTYDMHPIFASKSQIDSDIKSLNLLNQNIRKVLFSLKPYNTFPQGIPLSLSILNWIYIENQISIKFNK